MSIGGRPGDGGALFRENSDGSRTFFTMISYFRVKEGESWFALSSGGGGYGDPLTRSPELVCDDVRNGYVSAEAAERDYGLVLDPTTFEVDAAATLALRARLAGERQTQVVVPTTADAGTFYKGLMRKGDRFEVDPHPPLDADFTL